MYHAADFRGERADPYGTRHYAVYFGLSVVEPKTPAILRTLVDLCMRVDDADDLSRVAWGAKLQERELLEFLTPHLNSPDAAQRAKAQVLERIFKGELKAMVWAAEEARKRAQAKHAGDLPRMKNVLENGSTQDRRATLELVARDRITLIMDDSFVAAFEACAKDEDPRVRNDVAVLAGFRWVWSAESQHAGAIDLMLRLSQDPDRDVHDNAVYYGLSTVQKKDDRVIRRLLEMAFADREANLYRRIGWGLKDHQDRAAELLNEYLRGDNPAHACAAREVYKDITGREPPEAPPPSGEDSRS